MTKFFTALLLVCGAASLVEARPRPPSRHYYTEYLTCESVNNGYQECAYSPYKVYQVRLLEQHSYEPCIGFSGVKFDHVWVTEGCSATFEITRQR